MSWLVCGIASITMLRVPYCTLQATKSDISAVASLEDVLPNVDSQLSTLLSCPWLPGVISSRSGMLPLGATRHKPSSPMVVGLYSLAAAVDSSAAVADSSVAVMDTSPAVVDALAAADAGAPLAAAAAAAAYPAVEGPCMQPITPVGIFSASDSSADAAAEIPLYSA